MKAPQKGASSIEDVPKRSFFAHKGNACQWKRAVHKSDKI